MIASRSSAVRPAAMSRRTLVCRAGNIVETAKARGFSSFVSAVESGAFPLLMNVSLYAFIETMIFFLLLQFSLHLFLIRLLRLTAGLTSTLTDPSATFTVFVPTNEAFQVRNLVCCCAAHILSLTLSWCRPTMASTHTSTSQSPCPIPSSTMLSRARLRVVHWATPPT